MVADGAAGDYPVQPDNPFEMGAVIPEQPANWNFLNDLHAWDPVDPFGQVGQYLRARIEGLELLDRIRTVQQLREREGRQGAAPAPLLAPLDPHLFDLTDDQLTMLASALAPFPPPGIERKLVETAKRRRAHGLSYRELRERAEYITKLKDDDGRSWPDVVKLYRKRYRPTKHNDHGEATIRRWYDWLKGGELEHRVYFAGAEE